MSKREPPVVKTHAHHHTGEAAVIAGEIAGAVVGIAAGPAGMVAGMVVGALAGTLVGEGLEDAEGWARKHSEELEMDAKRGDLGSVRPEDESSPDWPMECLGTQPRVPE